MAVSGNFQIQMRLRVRTDKHVNENFAWLVVTECFTRADAIRVAKEYSKTSSAFVYRAVEVHECWSQLFVEGERAR